MLLYKESFINFFPSYVERFILPSVDVMTSLQLFIQALTRYSTYDCWLKHKLPHSKLSLSQERNIVSQDIDRRLICKMTYEILDIFYRIPVIIILSTYIRKHNISFSLISNDVSTRDSPKPCISRYAKRWSNRARRSCFKP